MPQCLDEGDVPAVYNAASLWVLESVGFVLLAIAAHVPFPGRSVELSGVLNGHEGSSNDDAKVREVGSLAMKHLEWRLHLKHLVPESCS